MRNYFIVGLAVILFLSVGIVTYGAYLNQQGELKISERMDERKLPLRGERAKVRKLYPRIKIPTLNLYADEMADAVALIDGRITESLASRNAIVSKGQPIFVVVNESIPMKIKEADSAIMDAQAKLRQAQNNYDRYLRLREHKAASAEQYDSAEMQYFAAQARLSEAQARKEELLVQESRQEVVAPLDGKLLMHYRQVGSYVQAGTPLALVGNFQTLYFDMPVEGAVVESMNIGQTAEIIFNDNDFQKVYHTSYESGNMGKEQEFNATVTLITPPLSELAKIRTIRWSVDNSAGLLEPQTYGGVNFKLTRAELCLSVPLSAMVDNVRSAVFVVRQDGTLEKRNVRTGVDDGKYVEILSGLSEGEIVVISGMKGLTDGVKADVELEGGDTSES